MFGFSVGFALWFFVPFGVVVGLVAFLAPRHRMDYAGIVLSGLWACTSVLVGGMIWMGNAFAPKPNELHPTVQTLYWFAAGLSLIWIAIGVRIALDRGESNRRD
ncbi:MAG TPA: hypothetical protein VEA69_15755 [Tepidisphaeraceae bacterium]|nr:hypothetical protein [Tepidisphaeraceae bacterium]